MAAGTVKSEFRVLAAPALGLVLALTGGCRKDAATGAQLQSVTLGGQSFNLEIAADSPSRIQGLSDRDSIAPDGGMLFVFPDAEERNFVMRRCPHPIDIIFLDASGRIVKTHEMQPDPPGTDEDHLKLYPSEWPAQFAIELREGSLRRLKLSAGQKIDLPLAELKRRAR